MRNVFIVTATQVVVSDNHPEGLFSNISGYPKTFDTLSYVTEDKALAAAKSEYYDRLSKILVGSETRVMATVTLGMANGRQIMRESIGAFPEVAPVEPEPAEE